jgi:hypothetical protein
MGYINEFAKDKLKKDPKALRLALIHEDGAYGTDVAAGSEAKAKELGLNLVLKEGYSISAPDLSSLVTKLRSQRPDVLFHVGYNPDIALFVRQAKEQGLRLSAYIGHGAGHSQYDKLKETFGAKEIEGFHTVDPIASQLLDPEEAQAGRGRDDRGDGAPLQGQLRQGHPRSRHRARTCRWASTTCGSCSTTSCRGPSASTAASGPTRSPRPRARPTSPRAAPCRATA